MKRTLITKEKKAIEIDMMSRYQGKPIAILIVVLLGVAALMTGLWILILNIPGWIMKLYNLIA